MSVCVCERDRERERERETLRQAEVYVGRVIDRRGTKVSRIIRSFLVMIGIR